MVSSNLSYFGRIQKKKISDKKINNSKINQIFKKIYIFDFLQKILSS